MKWASSSSRLGDIEAALDHCVGDLAQQLDGAEADLLLIFLSPHHGAHCGSVPGRLAEAFPGAVRIGCMGGGIIGGGHEVENSPGLALVAASLPGVELYPFFLDTATLATVAASPLFLRRSIAVPEDSEPSFLLLPDPFSVDTERILTAIDTLWPDATTLGGLASGEAGPELHALFIEDAIQHSGCVGIALCGNIRMDAVVAQGCKPVGDPMRVTRCRGNLLIELDDQQPTDALQGVYQASPESDQQLMRSSLFLGVRSGDETEESEGPEYLIRNVLAMDPDGGTLAIGSLLTQHQQVRFHVRDHLTSREDLKGRLQSYRTFCDEDQVPAGALLFSCMGRGIQLYGEANHDLSLFEELVGPVPVGGFFCNGEIGPVQGRPAVHGFTSVFALFSPRH